MSSATVPGSNPRPATVFGHPTGLFTLFFAEMWERFSYYGMRALLVLYITKGFLKYSDADAITVYGAYTALVYMTPFFGGMLADRLLGARRAVVLGGLLMAAGHLLMALENVVAFYTALALLIAGNGFFKPNISTIVGTLYETSELRAKRDGGFTIFYMGINLGAAMSPLLCGYIGETHGWHYGFGLATIGMLTGLAVFVAPTQITQLMIAGAAVSAGVGLCYFRPDNQFSIAINVFTAVALLAAAAVAWRALGRGGLPQDSGQPPDPAKLNRPLVGPISAEWTVYLGTLVFIPVFALLVSGFSILKSDGKSMTIIPDSYIQSLSESTDDWAKIAAVVLKESSKPAGLILVLSGILAFGYLGVETFRFEKVARERMIVVLILIFFSMLFWSFFEQAGSSLNLFTDRNVDRVLEDRFVVEADVGTTLKLQPTQEQLGYKNGDQLFTLTTLNEIREKNSTNPNFEIDWKVSPDNVGMGIARRVNEVPASTYQAVNPICILIFGLVFSALWTALGRGGLEPSTPFKFALGLLQLGLGFGCFCYGAQSADERGMVSMYWLILGYLFQTTGELCLSPVGLSMVTKLSPKILVSTVMGAWFLASAFSQLLAAIIAQFTGVAEGGEGGTTIPIPSETVQVYGDVFGKIAIAALISGGICLLLVPLLKRWMHEEPGAPVSSSGH